MHPAVLLQIAGTGKPENPFLINEVGATLDVLV
jgi:hypothetical protein